MSIEFELRVKKMLRRFTDDFTDEDVSFIMLLDYPLTLSMSTTYPESTEKVETSSEIECFDDLEKIVKKISPLNEVEITIPTTLGNMKLLSRREERKQEDDN